MLPENLKIKAMNFARSEKMSLGELIRELLQKKLQTKTSQRDCFYAEDLVFSGELPKDLSENHDDYLY